MQQAAQGYRKDRDRVACDGAMRCAAASPAMAAGHAGAVSRAIVDQVVDDIRRNYDSAEGGFAERAEVSDEQCHHRLIHRYVQTGDRRLLDMVTKTLDKMAAGGVRDQLSGRFHRYTTDR